MMTTHTVTPITATEARKRWESGLPIAMAGERDWFTSGHREAGSVWTHAELGMSWKELTHGGNNSTARAFAKPVPVSLVKVAA